jgi:8-oxo-dGTP pyrophosphatase MutT (NUDIX family)
METKIEKEVIFYASLILLTEDCKIIIAKRKSEFLKDLYHCTGGKILPEEKPKRTAQRECHEETSLFIPEGRIEYIDTYVYSKSKIHIDYVYYAKVYDNEVSQIKNLEPRKQYDWQYFPIHKIKWENSWKNQEGIYLTDTLEKAIYHVPILKIKKALDWYDSITEKREVTTDEWKNQKEKGYDVTHYSDGMTIYTIIVKKKYNYCIDYKDQYDIHVRNMIDKIIEDKRLNKEEMKCFLIWKDEFDIYKDDLEVLNQLDNDNDSMMTLI